jgi:hypothetical protein
MEAIFAGTILNIKRKIRFKWDTFCLKKKLFALSSDKDACVTPVLDMSDKTFGLFEHHRVRGSFELGDGKCWIPKPVPIEMFLQKEQPMKAKL